jgi:hypothetical protein
MPNVNIILGNSGDVLQGSNGVAHVLGYHYNAQNLQYEVNTGGTTTGTQVEVTNFPATQPVSISSAVPVTDNSGSLTVDGSVSVSNFPVSQAVTGTFYQATQPVSIATMPSTPVTGTFWQTTQPVSGTVTANATLAAETTKVIGTVNIAAAQAVTANAGTNLNTSALALDTSVSGLSLSQASATSGQKGVLNFGAVTTANPSYTTAQTNALSMNTAGMLRVENSARATFTANNVIYTPPATPTDMVILSGSASKTVKVLRTTITCLQTTAGFNTFFLLLRTAANTGGTLLTDTPVAHDQTTSATATLKHYSVNPTGVGAGSGNIIQSPRIFCPAAATASGNSPYIIDFTSNGMAPITLSGTAQSLVWNFAGAALPAGLSLSISFTWTEE